MKIIILSILLIINKSYIILPFKTLINETQLKKDFISSKFYNDIYVNIKVGSNEQVIPIQIRLHSYSFYIVNDLYNGEYNIIKYESSNSKTYESIKKLTSYYSDDFTKCRSENFNFNNLKIKILTSIDSIVKFHLIIYNQEFAINCIFYPEINIIISYSGFLNIVENFFKKYVFTNKL